MPHNCYIYKRLSSLIDGVSSYILIVLLTICFVQKIPFRFFKRACITQSGQIVMLQVGDKSWPVKLLIYPHLSSGTLSAGWFAFARDNTLQRGDICVFELIKSDNVVMKVSIFRHLS